MIPVERLSRFLTFLLRHRPEDYPLRFDKQGFVAWAELIEAVQQRFPEAAEQEILGLIQQPEKKRFELTEGRVRATYGHSFPVDLGMATVPPPDELYHGTARDLAQSILHDGLTPRGRQYVHLSASIEEAADVGRRRDSSPSIVVVDARSAHASGISFYASGPLYLAQNIPAKFLTLWRK